MTPGFFIQQLHKYLPKEFTAAIIFTLLFTYFFIDHFVFDLTPSIHMHYNNKLERIEKNIKTLSLCLKKREL